MELERTGRQRRRSRWLAPSWLPCSLLLLSLAAQAQDGGAPAADDGAPDAGQVESDAGAQDTRLLEGELLLDAGPAAADTDAGAALLTEDEVTAAEDEASEGAPKSAVWGEVAPPAEAPVAVRVDDGDEEVMALPAFPARHRGEILLPGLPPERWWGTRTTLSFFADDLLGFDSLFNPSTSFTGGAHRDPSYGLDGHFVAYGRVPTGMAGLRIEAALVARLLAGTDATQPAAISSLLDDGSYLKATWADFDAPHLETPRLSLTVFPGSSDRLRLGHLEELSWGGADFYLAPERITPAARVGIDWQDAYAFVAGRMVMLLNEQPGVVALRPFGSAFGGIGIDLFDILALQTGGGWFSRGTSSFPGTRGTPLPAFGVSTRAALHFGRSEVIAPDHRVRARDPALLEISRLGEETPDITDVNALVALEHSWIGGIVPLADDLSRTGLLPSQAVALSGRLELFAFSFALDGVIQEAAWRSIAVNLGHASAITGEDVVSEPEMTLGGSVSVLVPSLATSFALFGSLELPATLEMDVERRGTLSTIVRAPDRFTILPEGESRGPNGTLGVSSQVDIGPVLSLLISMWANADGNAVRLVNPGLGLAQRERITTFGQPFLVDAAAQVTLQLRL